MHVTSKCYERCPTPMYMDNKMTMKWLERQP
jgi:hypothetical protein